MIVGRECVGMRGWVFTRMRDAEERVEVWLRGKQ